MGKLILVTGGARSGKSKFAEDITARCAENNTKPVIYLAAAQALDDEMKARIQRHRARRPADWLTVEAPFYPAEALRDCGVRQGIVLLDCISILVSNLLLAEWNEEAEKVGLDDSKYHAMIRRIEDLTAILAELTETAVAVTSEVGMAIVPDNPLGRTYRDLLGECNQVIARHAEEVHLVVSGIPIMIKGRP